MTYGIGTHSFNNSTENRQMKRECAECTKQYEAGEIVFPKVVLEPICTCRSFRFAHSPSDHHKSFSYRLPLRSHYDWRSWEEFVSFDYGRAR